MKRFAVIILAILIFVSASVVMADEFIISIDSCNPAGDGVRCAVSVQDSNRQTIHSFTFTAKTGATRDETVVNIKAEIRRIAKLVAQYKAQFLNPPPSPGDVGYLGAYEAAVDTEKNTLTIRQKPAPPPPWEPEEEPL